MTLKSGKLLYTRGKSWIRNLNFDTPLRVISGGTLLQNLPFEVLIQFLCRRFSLLTQKYMDVHLEWDMEALMQQATQIKIVDECWKTIPFSRYSMNQKSGKLELDAITGWTLYEGDLSCFVPLLEAGKYLRVGKGATIGFGHYEVFYDQ